MNSNNVFAVLRQSSLLSEFITDVCDCRNTGTAFILFSGRSSSFFSGDASKWPQMQTTSKPCVSAENKQMSLY